VCTAVAFIAFFALIAEVGPMRATVITYINPAVAVVLGVTVLGEKFGPMTAVGFAAVLGGSVLATRSLRPSPLGPGTVGPGTVGPGTVGPGTVGAGTVGPGPLRPGRTRLRALLDLVVR
jgi:hypothetical protein